MGDYILRSKAIDEFINCISLVPPSYVIKILQDIPDADVVSGGVYRQTAWERDLAIHQLKEDYDVGLGEVKSKKPKGNANWVEYPRAHYFKCSNCKYTVPYKKAMLYDGQREYNYCPSCGAKMDKE